MSLRSVTGKNYGLIIPAKKPKDVEKFPLISVFGDESDEEDDQAEFKKPNFDVKLETMKASLRKTTKVNLEKALEEDATVFQYDEVYEDINRAKDKKVLDKCQVGARKPKYVEKLLKASAVRKLEKELLNERRAQRELEEEREKFSDKESFVTGAYKEKMSELRQLVEKRQEEEARESVMDVTKQDGLGGFYRFMYQQKTAVPEGPSCTNKEQYDVKLAAGGTQELIECIPDDFSRRLGRSSSRSISPIGKSSHHRRRSSIHSDALQADKNRGDQSPRSRHSSSQQRNRNQGDCSAHGDRHKRSHRDYRDLKSPPKYRNRDRSRDKDNFHSDKHAARTDAWRRHRKRSESPPGRVPDTPFASRPHSPRAKTPPGCIRVKPRSTTESDLEAYRQRYLARKEAGIKAEIVLSEDEM